MAATEILGGPLQQAASSTMGSSAILSVKPLHPSYEFGRSYKKHIPSLQASMGGKEDRGVTLRKPHVEAGSRSSSVSSLLKAVQEGGSSAVLQQVTSIRHFFMPELPQAIIAEIKKRMALSFKDQDDEESAIQDDLNGGLLEKGLEEQVNLMGPRCAWPRLKLVSAEEERREEATQGPRCAWPRAVQNQSSRSSVEQGKQSEKGTSSTIGEGRNYYTQEGLVSSMRYSDGLQEVGISKSSLEGLQKGGILCSQEGLEKEPLSKIVQEGKEEEAMVNNSVIEGPRCAWPRTTPRRMLATGVGLSLMNYLFIAQGAPALAILIESPLPMVSQEEASLSRLLP